MKELGQFCKKNEGMTSDFVKSMRESCQGLQNGIKGIRSSFAKGMGELGHALRRNEGTTELGQGLQRE